MRPQVIRTPALDASHQYSFLYSLQNLGALQQESRLEIEVRQSGEVILRKTLHAGDPDWYRQFRPAKAGPAELRIQPSQVAGEFAASSEPVAVRIRLKADRIIGVRPCDGAW